MGNPIMVNKISLLSNYIEVASIGITIHALDCNDMIANKAPSI